MSFRNHQSIGIDIGKASFTACIFQRDENKVVQISDVVEFDNTKPGFNQFLKWSRKTTHKNGSTVFIMEATGTYYEPLAYHLYRLKQQVVVALPNKVKHYGKSLNVKSKTDAIDARIIARMGAERQMEIWCPPSELFRKLRCLTRQYTMLKHSKTMFVNRLQNVEASEAPMDIIIKSSKAIILQFDKQIKQSEKEIENIIRCEKWLSDKFDKLLTIKGIGFITLAIILAETQGFQLMRNVRQLTSYAGYDVVQRESGTSVKSKSRISKKGNSHIRAAMYFPALAASRFNTNLKNNYQRIIKTKPAKMIGIVAIQRKLLILIYTLWKKNEAYDEIYYKI